MAGSPGRPSSPTAATPPADPAPRAPPPPPPGGGAAPPPRGGRGGPGAPPPPPPHGILATPVETVPRAKPNPRAAGPGPDIARIADIVREYEAVEIIVGLPRTLRGEKGTAATLAIAFADRLRSVVAPVPVRLSDERLTTVSAARALRDSGVRARGQRQVIDQAAAVSILQGWLDERSSVLKSVEEAVRRASSGDDA
ncbi:Holliday junction resolvase RuvX [Nocardia cyriacigeorgica]|uniref:Holliday junction resolvase RuvX n=1 Tax=Nocardia cyriacigeorgica TaxID=135487 RepID=UPI003D7848E6